MNKIKIEFTPLGEMSPDTVIKFIELEYKRYFVLPKHQDEIHYALCRTPIHGYPIVVNSKGDSVDKFTEYLAELKEKQLKEIPLMTLDSLSMIDGIYGKFKKSKKEVADNKKPSYTKMQNRWGK